jgi:antitoxin HigA-1
MARRKQKPIHPGEVLKHDFLDPMGLSAYRLSKEIGTSPQHIGRVIHGQRGIGPELALRLARFFGTTPELWANLQTRHDLDVAEDDIGKEIAKQVRPYQAA